MSDINDAVFGKIPAHLAMVPREEFYIELFEHLTATGQAPNVPDLAKFYSEFERLTKGIPRDRLWRAAEHWKLRSAFFPAISELCAIVNSLYPAQTVQQHSFGDMKRPERSPEQVAYVRALAAQAIEQLGGTDGKSRSKPMSEVNPVWKDVRRPAFEQMQWAADLLRGLENLAGRS